jgi:hypothetical protein
MANVKVDYEVFKLLDNGQIDNNCCKSGWCYVASEMNKDEIEALLNKAWGKTQYKFVVSKITKTNYPNDKGGGIV